MRMKTRFHVAPAWWDYDTLSRQPTIEAEFAGDAAAEYVRLNDANLDYPQQVDIHTLQYDDNNKAVVRKFEVVRVAAFETRRELTDYNDV